MKIGSLFAFIIACTCQLFATPLALDFEITLNESNIENRTGRVSGDYQLYIFAEDFEQQVALLDYGDRVQINATFSEGQSLRVIDDTAADSRGTEMVTWRLRGSGGWPDGWQAHFSYFQFHYVSGQLAVNPITTFTSGGSSPGHVRYDYGTLHDFDGIEHSLTDSYYEISGFSFIVECNGEFYNSEGPLLAERFEVSIQSDKLEIVPEPATLLLLGMGGVLIRKRK